MKRDSKDEDSLMTVLQRFGLFPGYLRHYKILQTNLVTQDIEDDLLNAPQKGQEQLDNFVKEKLMSVKGRKSGFRDKLTQNKYLTFSSLFDH